MIAPQEVARALAAVPVDTRTRVLLLAVRQALLIVLGAIETYLDMPRSVQPKHTERLGQ